jgi:hypothetical protein
MNEKKQIRNISSIFERSRTLKTFAELSQKVVLKHRNCI